MCTNKTDEYLSIVIINFDDQPIGIALNVENHSIVRKNAGMRICLLNVRR